MASRRDLEEKLLQDILDKLDNPTDPVLIDLVDKWARLVGKFDLQRFLGSDISLANPIYNAIVWASAIIDPRNIRLLTSSDFVNVSDRAARLLGVVYGSQAQQLLQRATTYDLMVQLRSAGVEVDPRDRTWNLGASDVPDFSDRAARLLGVIYGDQGQFAQRATTRDAYVQLRNAGSEIDPRIITDVEKVVDVSKYLTPTALSASATTIWSPAAGKKVRLKRLQVSVDAASRIDLRWATVAFESFYLPANGSIIVNMIGCNEEGAVDESLTIYSVSAANVTAHATGDEI